MTLIDGMLINSELVAFLKEYCPSKQGEETFLTSSIETVTNVQDFICSKLGDLNENEKYEVSHFLQGIVLLKKDLCRLVKLLPVIKIETT